MNMICYTIAYGFLVLGIVGLIDFNYRIAMDLIRRPRLHWDEYLSDASSNMVEWFFYLVMLWPGLVIGTILQDESKLKG